MRPPLRRGFTLIELLTVIAIIGILTAVLIPAALGVQKRARVANSQAAFSSWASGIVRYKQAYGFYPGLLATGYPSTTVDSARDLSNGSGTSNPGVSLIRSLTGKNPDATNMTQAERQVMNRNMESFIEFSKEDFEDPSLMAVAKFGVTPGGNFLVDRLGNRKIRVVIDYTGDSFLKASGLTAAAVPSDVRLITSTSTTVPGVPGRVLIYTSKTDVSSVDGTTAAGTENRDFADIIALQ